MTLAISKCLEALCRKLLCKLHDKDIWAIGKDEENKTKIQKNIIAMCLAY